MTNRTKKVLMLPFAIIGFVIGGPMIIIGMTLLRMFEIYHEIGK